MNAAVRALLRDAIDYAGLFPPAQLDMAGAFAEYASYLESDDAWALGRFVVPASRLEELGLAAVDHHLEHPGSLGSGPWRLSAVLGSDIRADLELVEVFTATCDVERDGWRGSVGAVEFRASTPAAIRAALRVVPERLERFVEIPIIGDTTALVREIGNGQGYAKVRTGGTTADAFPASADLASFLATCVGERVPFKATAGLHHPLRGDYALTYEPGSAAGRMYGFLNVILATAFLTAGVSESEVCRLLEEQDISALQFSETGVTWSGHRLTAADLLRSRDVAIQSFGSCSFREPLDDLSALGLA